MEISKRYISNLGAFSENEIERVREKSACVVGCGGLGGYVCGNLARFGIGRLTVIDGDSFSVGNLNRQQFATSQTLGVNKALACKEALAFINSDVYVTAHPSMLTGDNAASLLEGHDIVVDCLDSIKARRLLAESCEKLHIPLVHGAISGLYGQVSCIMPGDKTMEFLYPSGAESGLAALGNPVFTPALVASIQSCEAIRVLAGKGPGLRGRVLYIDLNNYDFEAISVPSDAG